MASVFASDKTGKMPLFYVLFNYKFHTASFCSYQRWVIHLVVDLIRVRSGLWYDILIAVRITAAVFWDVKLCKLA